MILSETAWKKQSYKEKELPYLINSDYLFIFRLVSIIDCKKEGFNLRLKPNGQISQFSSAELNSVGAVTLNDSLNQSYWDLQPGKYVLKNPFSDFAVSDVESVFTLQSLYPGKLLLFLNGAFSRPSCYPNISNFQVQMLIRSVRCRK